MKKILILLGICLLIVNIPLIAADSAIDEMDVRYEVGENIYLSYRQVLGSQIFFLALHNDIDFNVALKMEIDFLKG